MENYDRYVEIQEAAMDSEDASILQYSKTLDSLQSKLNQISNSFQQFYMSIANGPVIGGILDFLNSLISGFNKLGDIGSIATIINIVRGIKTALQTALTAGSPLFSSILTQFKTTMSQVVAIARKSGAEARENFDAGYNGTATPTEGTGGTATPKTGVELSKKAKAGMLGATIGGSALALIGTTVTGNGNARLGSALTMGGNILSYGAQGAMIGAQTGTPHGIAIGAAIGGVIGLITSLGSVISSFNNALQEEIDNLKQETEDSNIERVEAKTKADDLADYIDKWAELKAHQHDSTEAMQEYLDVSNEIAEVYPEYVSYIDESGNAIINMSSATQDLTIALEAASGKTVEWANNALKLAKKEADQAWQKVGHDDSYFATTDGSNWKTARTGIGRSYETTGTKFKLTDIAFGAAGIDDVIQAWKQIGTKPWENENDPENSLGYPVNKIIESILEVDKSDPLDADTVWEKYEELKKSGASPEEYKNTFLELFGFKSLGEFNTALETLNTEIDQLPEGSQKYQQAILTRAMLTTYGQGFLGDSFINDDYTMGSAYYNAMIADNNLSQTLQSTGSTLFSSGYNAWLNEQGGKNSQAGLEADKYGYKALISYQALHDDKLGTTVFSTQLSSGEYMEQWYEVYSSLITQLDNDASLILQNFADSPTSISMSDIDSLASEASNSLTSEQETALKNILDMWRSETGGLYESLASHMLESGAFQSYDEWVKTQDEDADTSYQTYWDQSGYKDIYSKISSLAPSLVSQLTNTLTELDDFLAIEEGETNIRGTAAYKAAEVRKEGILKLLDPNSIVSQIADPEKRQAVWDAILAEQSVDWQDNIIQALKDAGVNETTAQSIFGEGGALTGASFVNLNTAINNYYNKITDQNEAIVDILENGAKGLDIDTAKKKWSELGIKDTDFSEAFEWNDEAGGLILSQTGQDRITRELDNTIVKYETAQAAVKAAQEKFNNDSSGVDWGASTTTTFDDGSERQAASWWQRLGLTQDDELYKTLNDAIITGRAEGKTVEEILSETLSDLANSTDEKVIEWYKKYAEEVKEEFERTNAASDIKTKTSNFAKEYTDAFDDDYLKMLEEQYDLTKDKNGKYTNLEAASSAAGYNFNNATGELTRLPSAIKKSMDEVLYQDSDEYRALATDYEAASNSVLEKVLGFSGKISAADVEYLDTLGIFGMTVGDEWTEDNLNSVLGWLYGSENLSDADYSKGLGQVRHNALTLQDTYNQAVESLFSNIGTATLEDVTSFIEKVAPDKNLDAEQQDGLKEALEQGGEALWKYLTEDLELNIQNAESVYKASMNAGKAEAMSSITGLYDTFQDETLSAEEKVKEILSVFEMVGGLDDVDYDALMANVKKENWTAIIAQLLESFRTMFNGVITNQDWSDIAADFKEKMTDTLIGMNEKIINAYSGLTTGKTLAEAQQELKDLGLEGEIDLNDAYTWSDAQTGFVGTSTLYTKLQEKQQAEANAEAAKKRAGEQAVALEGKWGKAASAKPGQMLGLDTLLAKAALAALTPENYLQTLGINQTGWDDTQKANLTKAVQGKTGVGLYKAVLNYLTQLSKTYDEDVQQMLQDQTDYYAEQAQLAVQTLGASNQLSMQQSALQGYSSLTDTNFVKYLQDSGALAKKKTGESYTLDELATAAKEKGYLFNEATGELITTPEAIKNQALDAYNSTVDESSQITDVNQLTGQWAAQYAASMAAWRSNFFDTLMGYEGEVTEEQVAYLESIGLTYLHAGDKWTQLAKDTYITTAAGKGYLTSNQAEAGHRKNALDNNTHDIAKAAKKTQESFWNDYTDLTVADINTFYQEIKDTTQNLTTDQQNHAAEVLRKGGYDELYAFLTSAGDYTKSGLGLKDLDKDIFNAGKTDAMASTLEDIGDLGETLADTDMEKAEKVAEVMEIFEQLGELPEGIDVQKITGYITNRNWDGLWAALEQAFIKMFGQAESAQFQSAQKESNAKQIDKERENIEEIVSLVGDAVDGTLEAEKVLKVEKLYGNAGVQSYNMSGVTYTQTATGMQMAEDDALKAMAALAAAQPMYMDTILSSMQENGLLDNYTLIVALINEAKGGTERWGDATADVVKLLEQAKQGLEQDVNNSSLEASLMGESDDKFSNFLGQVSDYSTLLTQVSKGQRISYESGEKLFSVYASQRGWSLEETTENFEKWGEAVAATADMTDGGSIDFGAGLTAIGTSVTKFGETFAEDLKNFAQNRVDYLDGLIALLEGMDKLQSAFKDADDIQLPGFTYDDSKSKAENYQNAMAGLDNDLDWQRGTFEGKTWKEASGGLIPISQLLFGVAGVTADNFNAETYQQIKDRQKDIYNLLGRAMSEVDPQQYIDENDNLNESAYLAALIKQYQDLAKAAAEAAKAEAAAKAGEEGDEAQQAYDAELKKYQVDNAQYNTAGTDNEKADSSTEVQITADTDPATAAYEQFKNTVTSSPVQLNVNVPTTKLKGQIDQAIQYAKSQSVTLNVSVGRSSATGKASVTGNAYAEGTPSLVGELGPELAVYDNQYHILGQNGAEFVNLPHNAIIFNHKQTAGILNGRPGARGRVLDGGEAFVAGTGPAYAGNYDAAINALKRERSLWQGILSSLSFEDLIGSGGGGGGSNTIQATIQELTEWYNLTRQIRDLEIQINNLEAERENITDGHKYLRNLRETQELLQAQMITQKTLLDYQEKQLDQQKEQINENEIWNKFFTVDDDGLLQYVMGNETNGGKGTLSVLDQMNKMSGEEQVAFLKKIGYTYTDNDGKEYKDAELVQKFYEEAQTQIDKYDDLRDTVAETTETLEDLEGEINSINEEIRENQETLEQDVYDALVNKMETEIEDLTDQMELLKEANDAYINGLSDALQKERDLYSENQSTADREQLQRELSLLRRSGGSASKIASLEEQLDSTLQDEYFTHQQDTIDSIQEASDKQVEALNKQIELQQESLDYQKEAGVLWTKVYEIMAQNEEEIMDFLRGNSEGFYEKSQLAQEDALKEWSKEVGIYKEDSIWGQEFNSEEATKNFDSEAWNDSNFGTAKQAIYNALTADRQEDIKTHFATAYANAKTAGQTDEEAYDTAREAIYERLYASYSEQADAAGTADSDRLVTGSDSGKGWVQVQYGPGLGGTSAVAVGSSGHWYYTTDELKAQKPHVTFSTPTLKDKKGNKITNKGKISLNQKGGFTGVTRGTVKIFIGNAITDSKGKEQQGLSLGSATPSHDRVMSDGTYLKAATGALIEEDETPAILHKGEGVFTAKQTSALISMVDNYQKLATNAMGATLLSSFAGTAKNYSSLSAAPSNQTSSITIDPGAVVIQVEKLNDKYDVDSLATDVFNKITAIASKATNRGVNRR